MSYSGRTNFLRFWFPVVLYSGIIFYVSSVPDIKIPLAGLQFDKVLHYLAYIPFGFLVARGVDNLSITVSRRTFWICIFLASIFYGFSDEYHQLFVPGRNVSGMDVLWDAIGGVAGGYVYLLLSHRIRSR